MNYLYITRNDKDSLRKLSKQMKRKFGLKTSYDYENSLLTINKFKIRLWVENKRFIFLDAYSAERENNEYLRSLMLNVDYGMDGFSSFLMIKSYVENYLAALNKTKLRSEGIGDYTPFSETSRQKFKDYSTWLRNRIYQENKVRGDRAIKVNYDKLMIIS